MCIHICFTVLGIYSIYHSSMFASNLQSTFYRPFIQASLVSSFTSCRPFICYFPCLPPPPFFRYQNMFHLFCSHMINCNTDHRYTTYLIIYNIPIIHLSVNPFFNHLAFIYVTLPYIAFFIPYFTN